MPIISRQIIAGSAPAIAGLKLLNVTHHYGLDDEVQYPASEGLDLRAGLPARIHITRTGIDLFEASGLIREGCESGIGTYCG